MDTLSLLEILSKPGGGTPNDDRARGEGSSSAGHAWVIDGATGVTDTIHVPGADSDAAWLAERLDRYFEELPQTSAPVRVPVRRILGRVRDDFLLAIAGRPVPDYAIPSAAGLYCGWERCGRRIHVRFTGLGDCSAILRAADGSLKIIGNLESGGGDAGKLSQFAAFRGARDEASKAALWDFLKEQRRMMNRPGGYWVLSIAPEAAGHMSDETHCLDAPADMLLMTDGFARLIDHFSAYTPETLLNAACDRGLEPLYAELRKLEAEDAGCTRVHRVKAEDDASAVLIRLPG